MQQTAFESLKKQRMDAIERNGIPPVSKLSKPVFSVQGAILNRFGRMVGIDGFALVQISDRARHF